MVPRAVGVLNRLLALVDGKLIRRSRLAELEMELAALRGRTAGLETALQAQAAAPRMRDPQEAWRRDLLGAISGLIESKMNDAALLGYHEASRSTAEYILAHMTAAQMFRSPFTCARGDVAARDELLLYALSQVQNPGLSLEFGVFSGESINRIARAVQPALVYGFDSFEGLPEDWFFEMRKGIFDRKGQLPAVESNVRLLRGWFHETLPAFLADHREPIAFLHVDCDLYSSTACVFRFLQEQIVPGTVIVFDEYFNYPGWKEGEFKAFGEFMRNQSLSYEYLAYTTQWYSAAVIIREKSTTTVPPVHVPFGGREPRAPRGQRVGSTRAD